MDGRMTIDDSELDRFIEIVKINGAKKFATAPAVVLSLWRIANRVWRRRIAPEKAQRNVCLLYTSPSPRDQRGSRMPSSA